jgi:hypothetical protein
MRKCCCCQIFLPNDAIAGTETVLRLISRCSLLHRLTLKCRDDVSVLLAAAVRHCRQLKHLLLLFCPILTYADLQGVAEGLPGLRTLNLEV